jgi:hypothetical protein
VLGAGLILLSIETLGLVCLCAVRLCRLCLVWCLSLPRFRCKHVHTSTRAQSATEPLHTDLDFRFENVVDFFATF